MQFLGRADGRRSKLIILNLLSEEERAVYPLQNELAWNDNRVRKNVNWLESRGFVTHREEFKGKRRSKIYRLSFKGATALLLAPFVLGANETLFFEEDIPKILDRIRSLGFPELTIDNPFSKVGLEDVHRVFAKIKSGARFDDFEASRVLSLLTGADYEKWFARGLPLPKSEMGALEAILRNIPPSAAQFVANDERSACGFFASPSESDQREILIRLSKNDASFFEDVSSGIINVVHFFTSTREEVGVLGSTLPSGNPLFICSLPKGLFSFQDLTPFFANQRQAGQTAGEMFWSLATLVFLGMKDFLNKPGALEGEVPLMIFSSFRYDKNEMKFVPLTEQESDALKERAAEVIRTTGLSHGWIDIGERRTKQ